MVVVIDPRLRPREMAHGSGHTALELIVIVGIEQVEIHTMGEGFTWDTQDRARDIRAAQAGWAMAQEMIEACRGDQPAYDLVILDELNIVLRYDYLPLEEVVATLQDRPTDLHVVVTGRNAKPALIEAADLVTEMTQVKHPFREQGVMAQKGIEF